MSRATHHLSEQVTKLAWDCWSLLGVSGWHRREIKRVIDPEGLVLLTGSLGNTDPRLRQESQDWCLNYHWLLSRARLRTLRKDWPASKSWGTYAGALQESLGQPWPGAVVSEGVQETGKSTLRLGDQPALLSVTLRAAFGVGARTEILRVLLGTKLPLTAATIAKKAVYSKRSVAEAMQALSALLGGIVSERDSLLTSLVEDLGESAVGRLEIPRPGEDAWAALQRAVQRWLRARASSVGRG